MVTGGGRPAAATGSGRPGGAGANCHPGNPYMPRIFGTSAGH